MEAAGSQTYLRRHYFEKIFKEGLSFSGYERDKIFLNQRDGSFLDISGVSGADSPTDGRGVAFGDYDNDGDTDIFVHTIQGTRHLLFRNDVGTGASFVRVLLEGSKSNRDGIGAVVTASSGGTKVAKLRSGGSGFLSSHDPRLLFGLGKAAKADRIDVRWPSGVTQSFTDVPAGASIRVREGEARYAKVAVKTLRFADPPPEVAAPTLVAQGDAFPSLTLTGLDGKPAQLDSLRGDKDLLVNFWATWCLPCQHEMPVLERLAKEYGACVKVVGVSLDFNQADRVKAFLGEKGITYPVLLSDEQSPLKVFSRDKVLLPSSFLVGKDGKIRARFLGGSKGTLAELERELKRLCKG